MVSIPGDIAADDAGVIIDIYNSKNTTYHVRSPFLSVAALS